MSVYSIIYDNHRGYVRVEADTEYKAKAEFKKATGLSRMPYGHQIINVTRLVSIQKHI